MTSGAWGYGGKFRALKDAILAQFPDKVEVEGEATPERSGKFEVQVEGGKLAWSKIESGKFPTTEKQMEEIFACIEEVFNA